MLVKKSGGRASWRAVALANPCPMRLGGSLALPISTGFEFSHTFRGLRGAHFMDGKSSSFHNNCRRSDVRQVGDLAFAGLTLPMLQAADRSRREVLCIGTVQ